MCSSTPLQEEVVPIRCVTLAHTQMGKNTVLVVGKGFILPMDNVQAAAQREPYLIQIQISASLVLPFVQTALDFTLHSAFLVQTHRKLSVMVSVLIPVLLLHMPMMVSVCQVRSAQARKGADCVQIQVSVIYVFLITLGHRLVSM